MSGTSPLASLDHPVLSPSVGVREATHQDATPGPLGKKYDRVSTIRAGYTRDGSFSAMSKDTSDLPTDYFAGNAQRPDIRQRAQSDDSGSSVATPVTPDKTNLPSTKPTTEIRAGQVQKSFHIHTDLLVEKSLYFSSLAKTPAAVTKDAPAPSARLSGPFFFPNLDEFAFAMFVKWVYGGRLTGPQTFHGLNHYLCLYVLATDFQIETLKNEVMDQTRHYYRSEDMTAPAFRLDYIYANTKGPNLMKEFLVSTAAYRALSPSDKSEGISESVKSVLRKGGDLAADYATTMCDLAKNDDKDARKGSDCVWHEHTITPQCPPADGPEPWET